MTTNQRFSVSDFRNRFMNQIKNKVLRDCRTNENAPENWGDAENQFYSSDEINSILSNVWPEQGKDLSANQVYTTVMNVAKKLCNVREYHIERYLNDNGNWVRTSEEYGKGAFRNQGQDFPSINNPFKAKNPAKISSVTSFFDTIYNEWSKRYHNQVYYRYEYCHSNCHSNCHSSGRGRR